MNGWGVLLIVTTLGFLSITGAQALMSNAYYCRVDGDVVRIDLLDQQRVRVSGLGQQTPTEVSAAESEAGGLHLRHVPQGVLTYGPRGGSLYAGVTSGFGDCEKAPSSSFVDWMWGLVEQIPSRTK